MAKGRERLAALRAAERAGMAMHYLRVMLGVGALVAALAGVQLVRAADETVVDRLIAPGAVMEAVAELAAELGADGALGGDPEASAIPFLGEFLGADAATSLTDLFTELDDVLAFEQISVPDGASIEELKQELETEVGPIIGDDTSYRCGDVECFGTDTIDELTQLRIHLTFGDDPDAMEQGFTSLNLPSVRFSPVGQDISADFDWTLNAMLVVDDHVRLEPIEGTPELDLGVTIQGPGGNDKYQVDLGALKVEVTTRTRPTFTGSLHVDVQTDGSIEFSFGDPTRFDAAWDLITKDSPLMGVKGTLAIEWVLQGSAVDATGLRIAVDDIEMDMSQFVGRDLQSAAASIRDITRPLRKATSPLLEPIPGMSDFSAVLGGDDVTILRLLETADSVGEAEKTKLSETLERLQMLDDIVARLESGNGWVPLGSFEIVEEQALAANGAALELAESTLQDVLEACGEACENAVNTLLTELNGGATPGEGGMRFDLPVLTDPASLAGLLLGRDVELITFDTGKIGYDDELDIPLARFFIFSVELEGPLQAYLHLKGGVDTHGIAEALREGSAEPLLNGVYLQDPGDDAVVRVSSGVAVKFAAGIEIVEVSIEGGPDPEITLQVPESTKDKKLRPAIAEASHGGIGCALLAPDDARAEFGVHITAKFDYLLGEERETLAEHTFLSEADLCSTGDVIPVAEDGGNRVIRVIPGTTRQLPAGEPDTIKVFMRHDQDGKPDMIVVQGNGNTVREFKAADFDSVSYIASDDRPVIFRAVATDGKPFEKRIDLVTGDGPDQVFLDTSAFGTAVVEGGDDRVTVTASAIVNGGPGDDTIEGSDSTDVLGGGDGNDVVIGNGAFDSLTGGADDDSLFDTSPNANCLTGNEGNDLIVGGPGGDWLNGDEPVCTAFDFDALLPTETGGHPGQDHIVMGGGADHVVAGNGADDVRLHSSGAFPFLDRRTGPIDEVWYAGVVVYGLGGNDRIRTGNGQDDVFGGPGDDRIDSDAGPDDPFTFSDGDIDLIEGGADADLIAAGDGDDEVYGDDGVDRCTPPITGQPSETSTGGDDEVDGGAGDDRIALEAGDDRANGAQNADTICGHAGIDTIRGGTGADHVFGGTGNDPIDGEAGDDQLFGNADSDDIDGGTGADRIVGGSSASGTADAGDTLQGGDDADLIIGDNGVIAAGPPAAPSVFDLFAAAPATLGGADTIDGGDGEDRIFGGLVGDTIHGDAADDHLEGNSGDDAVYGDDGEDDLIGGTSPEALPDPAAGRTAADAPDVGETLLSGGAGRDVIIGDNGSITRPGGTDPIIGGVARSVTLLDRERTGAALAAVSGGDHVEGNLDSDRIYGQGGPDYLKGNEADDFIEGDQDGDRLEGNDGEDDLIGGSSFLASVGVGDPDGADRIAGGAGGDVLLGDNAAISRATTGAGSGFDWDSVANSWLGQTARRSITLFDKASPGIGRFGDDILSGGAGVDVLFGQDGADQVFGGSHDDLMEGNGGPDVLHGDRVAPATGDPRESGQPQLDGTPGPDGQDDQIGGSSWVKAQGRDGAINGQRDGADELHGDGDADVQLGDNGRILRRISNGQYLTHQPATGKSTIVRQAAFSTSPATALPARYDVGATAAAGVWGADLLYGDGGDDLQFGQDGDDTLYGGAADDDMYGELGHDRMSGESGEDAMVGDRGVITNRLVATPGTPFSVTGPPAITFTPFAAHPLDRRVDLNADGDGGPLQSPGMTTGGNDTMRGGPDHDSMHGAAGNDLMNGDSGGDILFGADGTDVLWGGKGRDCADPADLACMNDRGTNDRYVDYLFGGAGLKTDPVTGGADLLDFRPRPGIDPAAWFEATSTRPIDALTAHQHHQGIDWIYGGKDRDVLQANVADNGPNQGDKLLDWTGAYNLYVHCPAAYGGYNDVRVLNPSVQQFLEKLAFALGAGSSLAEVQTKGTSGFVELALVYQADVKANSGSSYPTTPGHFETFSCEP